jgi:FkbM family methyltransferase
MKIINKVYNKINNYKNKFIDFIKNVKVVLYKFFKKNKSGNIYIKYLSKKVFYSKDYSLIDRIIKDGYYEKELSFALKKELERFESPSFLDIGANIGLISIFLISKVKNLKIYAFEPGEHQYDLFKMTIENNELNNRINLFNTALGKENGKAKFSIHDNKDASGDGFFDTHRAGTTKTVEVNVTKFDDWWNKNNRPKIDIVKIDTEGAELWILQGAKEFLAACRPTIYMEINEENLKPYPYDHFDILKWVNENNLNLYSFGNTKITIENLEICMNKNDTFIVKS